MMVTSMDMPRFHCPDDQTQALFSLELGKCIAQNVFPHLEILMSDATLPILLLQRTEDANRFL